MDAKETMDLIYMLLVLLISTGSILLNVCLLSKCSYYETCIKGAEHQAHFWKGTALLYQAQMHEAADRYWKTPDELSTRV